MKKKKLNNHARQVGELENIVDLYGRRCKELEALLAIKDQRIQQLEKMLSPTVINNPVPGTPISVPTVWQIPGCQHEYPQDWNSTVPPSCRKCGMPAQTYQPYWVYSNTPNFQCNQQQPRNVGSAGEHHSFFTANQLTPLDITMTSRA
jgi:hypothetical protein